ncbi:MAG: hypothetical protein COT00_00015 [Candidatus Omnitrophica bacterium CG07_land_8_20_14_0_80_50_8]|nr:MAG: hypothetical protein AUJ71_02405 [Candidatus Omnitrophica bacterium CG1_02_49_16]PIU40760.1 MAG: hypothetical protein COT00_00015 [Candidatus Omnitrophica bacterium CG07_land_8_20_14_0_80_50_8]
MVIIELLGSLTFAIILISALGLTLIASTVLESFFGTPFVQKFFYQSVWFDIFLGFLALNILFSVLLRFPYKKRHTGFVITHAGILLLLAGSYITRLAAIDGQMMLYEGQKKDAIVQNTYELLAHEPNGKVVSLVLALGGREIKHRLDTASGPLELTVHRFLDSALIKTNIVDSPSAPVNHAALLAISSQDAGVNENVWLVENNPLEPGANRLTLGPAVFDIAEKPKEAPMNLTLTELPKSPTLHLYRADKGIDLSVDLQNIPSGDIPAGQSGLRVSNLKYYPDARVGANNTLVNASNNSQNPAVAFDVKGSDGQLEHYVRFALFPEFESMHKKKSQTHFDLSVDLLTPASLEASNNAEPSLSIHYSRNGTWSYLSKSLKTKSEGDLETGKTYQTGWMDFSFRAESLLNHATVSKRIERAPGSGKDGSPAAEVSVTKNGKVLFNDWVLEDNPQTLETGGKKLVLMVRAKNLKIPFELELKNFRKIDYPGTRQPSAFESDVILTDPKENLTLSKTISMNHPLDYKGYRIFQSSYIQDPMSGRASVFTVANNPGISLIYAGSFITFLGAFFVFFIAPYSSMLKEDKK